jgi:deoxyribodipyrimidine photo-lyase
VAILRGEKFDPDGIYVSRRVPELAHLPARMIHRRWSATPHELKRAGVELGQSYPEPIVDHKAGRERCAQRRRTASL